MEIEAGKWFVCNYEIREITLPGQSVTYEVIVAEENSPVKMYNPLLFEVDTRYKDGKKSHQPKRADMSNSEEKIRRTPEIELARLDVANIDEIKKFTSTYGLLGLWPETNNYLIYEKQTYKDLQNILRYRQDNDNTYRIHFELLRDFIRTAEVYKKAFFISKEIRDNKPGTDVHKLYSDFHVIANPYIEKIYPRIDCDIISGLPKIIWLFPGLINYCFFKLIQSIQGNRLKTCDFKKCNKPFLAINKEDNYCSEECRHKATMANLSIRKVKAGLRDMEKSGEISKEIRWTVGKKVQKLYDDGLKDYEKLFKKTIKLINDEKKEEK